MVGIFGPLLVGPFEAQTGPKRADANLGPAGRRRAAGALPARARPSVFVVVDVLICGERRASAPPPLGRPAGRRQAEGRPRPRLAQIGSAKVNRLAINYDAPVGRFGQRDQAGASGSDFVPAFARATVRQWATVRCPRPARSPLGLRGEPKGGKAQRWFAWSRRQSAALTV